MSPANAQSTVTQISLAEALKLPSLSGNECILQFPPDICFGATSTGSIVASMLAKCAQMYASNHPKIHHQNMVRSACFAFYRPIFPMKGPVRMFAREVSTSKRLSTLRVEAFQGGPKVAASADVLISTFAVPTKILSTGWTLVPPPHPVDLDKLARHEDPRWTCYQPAFYPDGFRRACSYVQNYIPVSCPEPVRYIEQWIAPGWDCPPEGSSNGTARWTTDMIHFLADMSLPISDNYIPTPPGYPHPVGSIASTLAFAATQKKARDAGHVDWRRVPGDGSGVFEPQTIHVSMNIMTEIKKPLPPEGVRWLYLRVEAKAIQDGWMDMEVLVLDEHMDLVALSRQVAQLVPSTSKEHRKANL